MHLDLRAGSIVRIRRLPAATINRPPHAVTRPPQPDRASPADRSRACSAATSDRNSATATACPSTADQRAASAPAGASSPRSDRSRAPTPPDERLAGPQRPRVRLPRRQIGVVVDARLRVVAGAAGGDVVAMADLRDQRHGPRDQRLRVGRVRRRPAAPRRRRVVPAGRALRSSSGARARAGRYWWALGLLDCAPRSGCLLRSFAGWMGSLRRAPAAVRHRAAGAARRPAPAAAPPVAPAGAHRAPSRARSGWRPASRG